MRRSRGCQRRIGCRWCCACCKEALGFFLLLITACSGSFDFHGTLATSTIHAGASQAADPPAAYLFARDNLVAWCIVPFDGKRRGPEERVAMLKRLGFKRFAFDWRAEHLPTFDREDGLLKRAGTTFTLPMSGESRSASKSRGFTRQTLVSLAVLGGGALDDVEGQ